MNKQILVLLALSMACAWPGPAQGQVKNSENTFKLAPGKPSPPAELKAARWLAGRWQGKGMGGEFEETWNPPKADMMMGMFRFGSPNQSFLELLTIVTQDETLLLRLKHFDTELKGWEEKDQAVEFKLVEVTDNEMRFEGLTFRRLDDDRMNVFVVISAGGNEEPATEIKFECRRIGDPFESP